MANKKSNEPNKNLLLILLGLVIVVLAYFIYSNQKVLNKNNRNSHELLNSDFQNLLKKYCSKNDGYILLNNIPLIFSKDFAEKYGHELKCLNYDDGMGWLATDTSNSQVKITISDKNSNDLGHGGMPSFGKIGQVGRIISQSNNVTTEYWGGWGDGGPAPAIRDSFIIISKDILYSDQHLTITATRVILPESYKDYADFLKTLNTVDANGNYSLKPGITPNDADKLVVDKYLIGDLLQRGYPIGDYYKETINALKTINTK